MNATCAVYMSPGGRIEGWSLVPLFSSVSRSGGRPNSIHLFKWKRKICSDEYLIMDHSCFLLNNSQIRETMSQCAGQKTRNMWNLGNLKKLLSGVQRRGTETFSSPLPMTSPHLSAGTAYVTSCSPPDPPTLQSPRPRRPIAPPKPSRSYGKESRKT